MIILFQHWNNTKEENEDTVTDDTEGMSTPPPPPIKRNDPVGGKGKDKESSIDDIGKVNMDRVEKDVEYDNGIFDGDVTVI